jgi:hypothetical protein
VIVLVFCILSLLFFVNSGQSDDIIGTVTSTNWTRSITIEEYGVVTNEGWYNEIPLGAEVLSCSKQFHHAQDEPVEDGEKFCGTPYTIDQGSGYAEVVQDCEYLVHQDFCSYSVNDWQPVDIVTVKGTDQQPEWPDIQYLDNQKPGSMEESYSIQFESNGQMFSYETRDSEKFFNAYIGSRWLLSVNSLGNVVSIQQEQ